MKLVPLFDKVVLEKEKMEETTKSGIVLPGQDDKEKPGQAVVVAVGPGGVVDGKEISMQVKKGQHVLFSRYAEVYCSKAERYFGNCGIITI